MKMSDEKQPVMVALSDELVAEVRAKYGDNVILQDVANKAVKFLLAATAIPADVLSAIGTAQTQLRDLANVVSPVKNFCESIDKSMREISPVATSAIGDSIANMQERAKEVIAKKEATATKAAQVTIGMSGKPQNAKPKPVNEPPVSEAKEPAKKITNELVGNPPTPEVAKILAEMKKNKPVIGHPASVIGPNMGREIGIDR